MMNICAKFHWNPSTKYNDIASRELDVNGWTDGQTDRKHNASVVRCWKGFMEKVSFESGVERRWSDA